MLTACAAVEDTALEGALESAVARGAVTLPMLPEVPRRLMAAASSESIDALGLSELIRRDPGVAGHVLRMANSAAFGGAVRIVSLQQAVARLGLDAVRRIALAIAVEAKVFRVPGFERLVRSQFERALGAAWVAQELARLRRLPVEEAFLAGLFHDIGMPALIQAAVALGARLGQPVSERLAEALAAAHHQAVGAHIGASWGLPARLVEVLGHHHAPERAGDCAPLCRLVTLSDDVLLVMLDERPEASLNGHPSLGPLGLYPEDVARVLARRDTVLALIRSQ